MSFSATVKQEIIKQIGPGGSSALLCGAILSSGSLVRNGGGISFEVLSENEEFIELVKRLVLAGIPSAKFTVRQENVSFKQKSKFCLAPDPTTGRQILAELGILSFEKNGDFVINRLGGKHLTIEREQKIDFVKGLFLGSGSVSIPDTIDINDISKVSRNSGYHLEWVVQAAEQADYICTLLAEEDIFARKVERNDAYVVYLKEGDSICNVLGLFKAYNAVLRIEDERTKREMRNLVNRQANCISANIDKSVSAALVQLDAIEKIRQTIGIDSLPEPLKEAAVARLNNPEGSLNDILEVLPTKISKGALSQRFKKLIELSKEVL